MRNRLSLSRRLRQMKVKQLVFPFIAICILIVVLIHKPSRSAPNTSSSVQQYDGPAAGELSVHETNAAKSSKTTVPVICSQTSRQQHLKTACEDSNINIQPRDTSVLYIPENKVGIAVAEHSRTLAWANLLRKNSIEEPVTYESLPSLVRPLSDVVEEGGKIILDVSNPFERLYSAYLERIFVPLSFEEAMKVALHMNPNAKCPKDITFEQFLKYVVEEDRQSKTLDLHWAKMASLFTPCNIKVTYVILDDSNLDDTLQVFTKLGYEIDDEEDFQMSAGATKLEALLKTFLRDYKTILEDPNLGELFKSCFNAHEVSSRMWQVLDRKGFFGLMENLPDDTWHDFRPDSIELFDKLPGQKYHFYDKYRQVEWWNSVQTVYNDVPKKTIQSIVNVYTDDFQLFGLSTYPMFYDHMDSCNLP